MTERAHCDICSSRATVAEQLHCLLHVKELKVTKKNLKGKLETNWNTTE